MWHKRPAVRGSSPFSLLLARSSEAAAFPSVTVSASRFCFSYFLISKQRRSWLFLDVSALSRSDSCRSLLSPPWRC